MRMRNDVIDDSLIKAAYSSLIQWIYGSQKDVGVKFPVIMTLYFSQQASYLLLPDIQPIVFHLPYRYSVYITLLNYFLQAEEIHGA